ncbi:MAG: EamA family transporter [Lachnospiraceae bacterium]|nr:EamA family transporter [Lachnospiraceae bacterium]
MNISSKSWIFLVLSGAATGASWLCYFKALSVGDVNKVAPIDKSSTVLSVLLAIIIFGETNNMPVKLIGIVLIGVGTYLMIEKKVEDKKMESSAWMLYAVLSAVFAALTSILAKLGISGVESNLATAIRTVVILIISWGIVFAKGEQKQIKSIDKKELVLIGLSGLATGASWLCYYYAIQKGMVSVVVPIDKMSILLTILFSRVILKEKLGRRAFTGLCLMCAGTLLMVFQA